MAVARATPSHWRRHGTVTYQGKLLDHGDVVFSPENSDRWVPATGAIAQNGSYEMRTGGAGAPLGKCVVTVHCRQKPDEKRAREMNYIPPLLIPEKYTNTKQSPLQFEVKPGNNKFAIVLE